MMLILVIRNYLRYVTCYDCIRQLKDEGVLIMMPQIENEIRRHNWFESLVYHLLPGALIGAVYYLIVPFIQAAGYPSVMALIITAIIVLIPVELGVLFCMASGGMENCH